jgi:hypothetical protein
MPTSFHGRFLALVAEIERRFPVARWACGDVALWPLARMDLYLDMFWANAGAERREPEPFRWRTIAHAARPLRNFWKSRRDLRHWVPRPRKADVALLGDGVSLDRVDGRWQDRFGEVIVDGFERRGLSTFIMQPGALTRLPWRRPTYAANLVAGRGYQPDFADAMPMSLPALEEVLEFLKSSGVVPGSLNEDNLRRRVGIVAATAAEFERVLAVVQPKLAFVVTYYADLGPAFALACRRLGILLIDLQHCPQEGAHKAYEWLAVPATGYATLPAIFWSWTAADAAAIRRWTAELATPWHRSVHGGHTQIAPFLDNDNPKSIAADLLFRQITREAPGEREIVIALQPISGYRNVWKDLAVQIRAAPPRWRWWIRRHPAASPLQDSEYASLLSLRQANVKIEEAGYLPLPGLLRHMSALVSLYSGAAVEAEMFGVPAFFLSSEAHATFPSLLSRGGAQVIDVRQLAESLSRLQSPPRRPAQDRQPQLDPLLCELEQLAVSYSQMCHENARPPQK